MEYPITVKRIRIISSLQIIVSLIFWVWAMFNILNGKLPFDCGIISFVIPPVAGIFGLKSVQSNHRAGRGDIAKRHYRCTVYGHGLVTLNYIGGSFLPEFSTICCFVSALLWTAAGFVFTRWIHQWIRWLHSQKKK